MTNTLLDLSGKINSLTVSVLSHIQQVASKESISIFIVGATARDILLEAAHGIAPKRATADIDIAAFLENWFQFDRVKEALVQSTDFEPGRETQRLIFKSRLPVDLVPFGGIAETDDYIEWPPDRNFRMSVAGFEECYRQFKFLYAIDMRLCGQERTKTRLNSHKLTCISVTYFYH